MLATYGAKEVQRTYVHTHVSFAGSFWSGRPRVRHRLYEMESQVLGSPTPCPNELEEAHGWQHQATSYNATRDAFLEQDVATFVGNARPSLQVKCIPPPPLFVCLFFVAVFIFTRKTNTFQGATTGSLSGDNSVTRRCSPPPPPHTRLATCLARCDTNTTQSLPKTHEGKTKKHATELRPPCDLRESSQGGKAKDTGG